MNTVDFISEYVSHPSVSTDPAFADGMKGARGFMVRSLERLGFEVERVETPMHPILLAERGRRNAGWPHIVIYSHYDVQPADPLDRWTSEPFAPQVRDGRLFGRGAADNKGPTGIQVAALARVLEDNPNLPLRITWLIEGEEETGSPSFPGFLDAYAGRLSKADFVIMSDSGSPSQEQIVITTGLRGLVGFEVEVTGPRVDLHSGIHGGAVHNPAQALCSLIGSLYNDDGSINVPGFNDGIAAPEPWEREELARLDITEATYQGFLGVPALRPTPGLTAFEAVRFAPTLEVNGIGGGYQGTGSKTIIPSQAFAKLTARLVANQTPAQVAKAVTSALESRCPPGVRMTVKAVEGGSPYRVVPPVKSGDTAALQTPLGKAFAAADAAVTSAFGKQPLYLREGGSVPIIAQLKERAGLDTLMIGLFTPEDNLHAPDEGMSLKMMERGTDLYAELFRAIATGNESADGADGAQG